MEITNEELPAVDGIEGYTGVLSTDATLINGSIFTDIELKLDDVAEVEDSNPINEIKNALAKGDLQ